MKQFISLKKRNHHQLPPIPPHCVRTARCQCAAAAGPYCTNHDTSAENCDVRIDLAAYRRSCVVIEVYGMNYLSNAGDVGAGNEYHPYGFTEMV